MMPSYGELLEHRGRNLRY